jgi:hypothetical protein
MRKNEIDEAFEWLVVILGVVTAILIQYPEYFYTLTPGNAPASLKAAIAIIPPMVITVVVWLTGKLSERDAVQALAKTAAWMLILSMTWTDLYSYFQGVIWAGWGIAPANLSKGFGLAGLFLLTPVFTHVIVVPRYRRMYPGLAVLRRKWPLLVIYLTTPVFAFLWHMNTAGGS